MDAESLFDPRELEKRDAALLDGLRTALNGDEHRLYKSGKFEGLFAQKTGHVGEAATLALREKLLEHTRTETRGRFEIDWVKLTPQGIEYLYTHDSPKAILGEMRDMLRTARSGIPLWQDEMLKTLERLATNITEEMANYLGKLDALTTRVDEALRRMDVGPLLSPNLQAIIPWGLDALTYLDMRTKSAVGGPCTLPELFAHLQTKHSTLTLRDYHDGLRRLADNHAIQLTPHAGTGAIPQPEFALMDSGRLLYCVSR
jgi:hypothetical protein